MDSLSSRYYEHQLGAGMGPELSFEKLYGYTEPIRRLIQREEPTPQVNEIPNTMPSWLPGDDYLINFRKGGPFSKIDQGYARLPGAGYSAIHPELKTRVLRPWPRQKISRARAASRSAVEDAFLFPFPLPWRPGLCFAVPPIPSRLAGYAPRQRFPAQKNHLCRPAFSLLFRGRLRPLFRPHIALAIFRRNGRGEHDSPTYT